MTRGGLEDTAYAWGNDPTLGGRAMAGQHLRGRICGPPRFSPTHPPRMTWARADRRYVPDYGMFGSKVRRNDD